MNTFNKPLAIISLIAMFSPSVRAQEIITHEYHGIRAGDSIQKQQVAFINVGDAGQDVVWDFADMDFLSNYEIRFLCDSDSLFITELAPNQINRYSLNKDTLMILGTETPLNNITFSQPIQLLTYPMSYNSACESSYKGTGLYCTKHDINIIGDIFTEADGFGQLILPSTDTLSNILRLHIVRTGSLNMQVDIDDSTEYAPSPSKQEIEERYLWYSRGLRYPVLETISTSYYDDMNLVSCIQTAYCCFPSMQHLQKDELNEQIQTEDSLKESLQHKPQIINYSVTANGGMLHFSYSLSENANISLIISNHQGMTYRRESFSMPAGDNYSRDIDCSGLLPGTYILYINVNGTVYSDKVKI